MNANSLCMGCMTNSFGGAVCPACGYGRRTPAESPLQLPPRTILQDKYVLGRVLGQGGFGITYLAYDLENDRKLAIKEYFPAYISTRGPDQMSVKPISRNRDDMQYGLTRFHEEGQALFRFREHPNVVQMVEFFYANGTGYIVMLYIEGCTLKQHLDRKGGKESFAEVMRPIHQVMDALRDLHTGHFLHRDISPDNIYLEDSGGVRLLDFGTTRLAMGEQSRSLSVVLKPGYAPEEQYRSRGNQGAWTDIYALGATIYRATTGRVPPDSMDRLQMDTIKPPSQLGVEIPPRAEGALLKALAVRAENRFQSIAEFRAALDPGIAPPPEPKSSTFFIPAFAVSLLLSLVGLVVPSQQDGWYVLSALSFACLAFVLFWKMWRAIQDGQASTTPGKAIGFLFIPVFSLYWIFRVIWGYGKDYNKFIDRHNLAIQKMNEPLFLVASVSMLLYSLFSLLAPTPVIMIMLLINGAVFYPVVLSVCKGIDALQISAPKKADVRKPDVQGRVEYPVAAPVKSRTLTLHCLGGEYQGQDIQVEDEIVIGRNATLANLVLASKEVSGRHVRVWRDGAQNGAWVEDLHSTNGTFYREARSPEKAWARLSGGRLLSVGDRFRLSTNAAEFEVKMT